MGLGTRLLKDRLPANRLLLGGLTLATAAILPALAGKPAAAAEDDAQVRIVSYATPSGDGFFAASILPAASDSLLAATRQADADVVLIIDTSASQMGEYRRDSMAAVRTVCEQLDTNDRVRLFAADVKPTDLSGKFGSATASLTSAAVEKLGKRLPLGNTNLVSALDAARTALVAEPSNRTRSVIYVGDGASLEASADRKRFEALIDALRADHISVHSIVIGPTTHVEIPAILANQTGGVLGIADNREGARPVDIARAVGKSSTVSPIWLKSTKLLDGMQTVQKDRLPPLRLDRDSILLGRTSDLSDASGQLTLIGETTTARFCSVGRAIYRTRRAN